jgi:type IV secretory pathway VirJ component
VSRHIPGLPLIDCPLPGGTPTSDTFAIFFSGDGGWARFERGIARRLVAAGMPVVGWSAFRYLWRQRTPDSVAADLSRVIQAYGQAWQCRRVVLVGFSRGADLLPFAFNRLPGVEQARVVQIVLLGIAPQVAFRYRLRDWLRIGRPPPRRNVLMELAQLPASITLCVNGQDDTEAASDTALSATGIEVQHWPGGHHIGRDHVGLAWLISQRSGHRNGHRNGLTPSR